MKRFLICCFIFFYTLTLGAENTQVLRAPVWVYLESVPGSLTQLEIEEKLPPIQELDHIGRFILGGMIYGWKFTYIPYDKTRKVEEFFSLEPVQEIPRGDPRFFLANVKPEYPRLSCWAEFTLDESLTRWTAYWDSILFKPANGRGRGERSDDEVGIKNAYTQAVLFSVRDYARKQEKNKPKEISGEVILRDNPRLFAEEGYFVADIRVLIKIAEIVPYRTF